MIFVHSISGSQSGVVISKDEQVEVEDEQLGRLSVIESASKTDMALFSLSVAANFKNVSNSYCLSSKQTSLQIILVA